MNFLKLQKQAIMALALVILATACLLTTTGCEFKNPFEKKSQEPAVAAPLENDDADDFQGYYLTVKIDGYQTDKLKTEGYEQIWTTRDTSPSPTVIFKVDEYKLGTFKTATVSINPLINGKPNIQDIWQYASSEPITPDYETQLNLFNHFFDGRMVSGQKELPAGKYRLNLKVNCEEGWDRQYIDFEIK